MLRSVRNDATQRIFWSAPISEIIMALYYDLPVFLFCAILIFIDLTKKRVGGILKERGSARFCRSSPLFCYKAVLASKTERAALLFNSFYFLSKKGLSE